MVNRLKTNQTPVELIQSLQPGIYDPAVSGWFVNSVRKSDENSLHRYRGVYVIVVEQYDEFDERPEVKSRLVHLRISEETLTIDSNMRSRGTAADHGIRIGLEQWSEGRAQAAR